MEIHNKTDFERYHIYFLMVLTIIFVSLLFLKPAFLDSTMLRIDDWKYALPTPQGQADAYNKVVVVEVDERSINELGRWPWDRALLAKLLTRMHLAKVIGMDIVLSEPSTPKSDQALADAVAQGNVILGYFFRDAASQVNTTNEDDILDECGYNDVVLDSNRIDIKQFSHVEANIPAISAGMLSCGYFNVQPDQDGLYRRYTLAYLYHGVLLSPLAVQMAKFILNKEPQLRVGEQGIEELRLGDVDLKDSNTLRILFDQPVVKVSATDIIHNKVPEDFFSDKAVIIGVTELGIFDLRPTPYEVITPGVYLHYYALRNLMNNVIVSDLGNYGVVLIVLFMIGAFLVNRVHSTTKRIGIYLLMFSGVFFLSAFLYVEFKWWLRDSYVLISMLIGLFGNELFNVVVSRTETSKTKSALSSYISKELMKEVLEDPEKMKLGGEERELTTLFADIRNFTGLSETLSPTDLVNLLNEIFDPLTNKILEKGGMLDKYIGDAIMALYNAPIDQEEHAYSACVSALNMVNEIHSINENLRNKNYPEIDIGIGINTGNAVVGNMGSRIRFNYTAIGDSVNLASRVEGLNKYYGTRILLSEFSARKLKQDILLRKLDKIRVKGKEEAIWIYELMQNNPRQARLKQQYESAMELYQDREFETASTAFEILEREFSDKASGLMRQRCHEYVDNPPGDDWSGVYVFKTK